MENPSNFLGYCGNLVIKLLKKRKKIKIFIVFLRKKIYYYTVGYCWTKPVKFRSRKDTIQKGVLILWKEK